MAPNRTGKQSVENLLFLFLVSGVLDIPTVIYGVLRLHTTTTCRQLGNDTTYNTEKKNRTSHDVADMSAVSGRRVSKTRRHVFKTNCGRHLKKRHFQLSSRLSLHYSLNNSITITFNPCYSCSTCCSCGSVSCKSCQPSCMHNC